MASVAEVSKSAGFYPAGLSPDASAREEELAHESAFFDHDLTRFTSARHSDDPEQPWDFILGDPVEAETTWLAQPYADMKKMALCRALQLDGAKSSEFRDHVYSHRAVPEILSMLAGTLPVPLDPGALPRPLRNGGGGRSADRRPPTGLK